MTDGNKCFYLTTCTNKDTLFRQNNSSTTEIYHTYKFEHKGLLKQYIIVREFQINLSSLKETILSNVIVFLNQRTNKSKQQENVSYTTKMSPTLENFNQHFLFLIQDGSTKITKFQPPN